MKAFVSILTALLFNTVVSAAVAGVAGIPALPAVVAANVLACFIPALPAGLREGVLTEIWTGELVKSLRGKLDGTWLDGIPDASSVVNNDVIHLVEVGVDPDVLVNNTTYPIATQKLDDKDISISLDKFQTKVTPITDDELYAISYDKMTRVKESHANAISDSKFAKAAHALCAQTNTATTPVLKTSGTKGSDGRSPMTLKDVIAMKAAMDKLKVPATGRRLVLCPDHVNDLLASEQSFREQYNINRTDGVIGRLYGFDIYEFANNPLYTTGGAKKTLGATATTGEFQCSFAFYVPRVFKATGSTKMYYREAITDPEHQQNTINFRHYFICMPKKGDAGVVMTSTYSA